MTALVRSPLGFGEQGALMALQSAQASSGNDSGFWSERPRGVAPVRVLPASMFA